LRLSINAFVSSPDARQTFANLNAAVADLRGVLADIDRRVGPAGDELARTLADAQAALRSLDTAATATRNFVTAQSGVGDEVTQALRQLADAAAAFERLAGALERNPSSLIVGKEKAEK
jgi:paraquat-inducible protein B